MILFLITGQWIRRSYPQEYRLINPGDEEVHRISVFLYVLRFRVVDYKFGSRMMNRICKDMAQGFIVVMLFMMLMTLLAGMVMVMMVGFSFLMVMVGHEAMDQRQRVRQECQ